MQPPDEETLDQARNRLENGPPSAPQPPKVEEAAGACARDTALYVLAQTILDARAELDHAYETHDDACLNRVAQLLAHYSDLCRAILKSPPARERVYYAREEFVEAGRHGGRQTASRHDREHLVECGRKGGRRTASTLGREHYQRISLLGVEARRAKKLAGSGERE